MPSIVIQLHPSELENADLDLIYELPDVLAELADMDLTIEDDGYDYAGGDLLQLFLNTNNVPAFEARVLPYLEQNQIMENRILTGCVIAEVLPDGSYRTIHAFSPEQTIWQD